MSPSFETASGAPAHQERELRRRLRDRLDVRLAVALCLGAAVILVAAGTWNLNMQRRNMIGMVQASADRIVATMQGSTHDAMMRNDPDDLSRMVDRIGAQQEVYCVRVIDKEGRVTVSSLRDQVGAILDVDEEGCAACHQLGLTLEELDLAHRVRYVQQPDGTRALGIMMPIVNDPECSDAACHAHPASQRVLGVLDAQLSLATVDERMAASERQMVLGLVVTVAAVLALALFLTWAMVLQPVHRLTHAEAGVTAGDLSIRVPETSSDEIGQMIVAWNFMVEELANAQQELKAWGGKLERRVDEKTQELRTAQQRMILIEKMASLGKLAAVMAHEINNPLAGIATYARLLQKKMAGLTGAAGEFEDASRILKMMESEAIRCGDIVRNLLLFSRAPGTGFAPEEIVPILERCIMLVHHKASLQEVKLGVEVDDGVPAIVCDAGQMEQMILALVVNAIEATEPGGSVSVAVQRDEDAGEVVLTVADDGRGIPPENLANIFEPFFSTKEQTYGAGLGLAVVYGIVTRHRGEIDVDSEPGIGTKFIIRLPERQPTATGEVADDLPEITS